VRVALVHDWLDRPLGGAERVLLELAALYPEAPIYTLLFDATVNAGRVDAERVRTSWLQRLPAPLRRRPRYLLPLIPTAVERWDFADFDVVISSSAAFVKNLLTPPRTLHVCYCHSPMRFAWDHWPAYLDDIGAGPLKRAALGVIVGRLRLWDLAGAARGDAWLANSQTTAARLRKFYRVDPTVIYPPVDVSAAAEPRKPRDDVYVTLSTLTEYKRVDLAVRAFTESGRRLVVVGEGPDRGRLERMAGATVSFAGHVSDSAKRDYLASARALIFPSEEDFGMAAVEALSSGTPVVAYSRGGITESVEDGRTGVLFGEQTTSALNDAVERLERSPFDSVDLVKAARRFAAPRFRAELRTFVESAHAAHVATFAHS
jgi:glycosyltransferase involved in cell wall biosynthesis